MLAAFLDRCTGRAEEALRTKEHVVCFELTIGMTEGDEKGNWNERKLIKLQIHLVKLKPFLRKHFIERCDSSLFTLKFCFLGRVVKVFHAFEALFVFDASPFEQYDVNRTQTYRQASRTSDKWIIKTAR